MKKTIKDLIMFIGWFLIIGFVLFSLAMPKVKITELKRLWSVITRFEDKVHTDNNNRLIKDFWNKLVEYSQNNKDYIKNLYNIVLKNKKDNLVKNFYKTPISWKYLLPYNLLTKYLKNTCKSYKINYVKNFKGISGLLESKFKFNDNNKDWLRIICKIKGYYPQSNTIIILTNGEYVYNTGNDTFEPYGFYYY